MDLKKALEREQEIYEGLKARERAAREAESQYWAWLYTCECSDCIEKSSTECSESVNDGDQSRG